jgi:hypothetical protein
MAFNLWKRPAWHNGVPLSWTVYIDPTNWGFPLALEVHPKLTDGSGRKHYVLVLTVSVLCLHLNVHYAWGKRKYLPPSPRVLSLREIMEHGKMEEVNDVRFN